MGSGSTRSQPYLNSLSPVSLFKFCLQVPDPIPGPWLFFLQQIQAINHWWVEQG